MMDKIRDKLKFDLNSVPVDLELKEKEQRLNVNVNEDFSSIREVVKNIQEVANQFGLTIKIKDL